MSAYCTLADVQNEFKQSSNFTFAAGQTVTDTMVNNWIAQCSALIDSKVGQRWTTPIVVGTSPIAFALMNLYCVTLVASKARGVLANKQVANPDGNQNVKQDGLTVKDVMTGLQSIADGLAQLQDGVLLNQNASMYSNNNANGVNPRFRKSVRQW